jgi:hypothetical protein
MEEICSFETSTGFQGLRGVYPRRYCSLKEYILYLDALFCEILAGTWCQFCNHQSIANSLHSAIHSNNSACAFSRDVQVVRDCSCCHLQYVVRSTLVQEDSAQSGKECAGGTTVTKCYDLPECDLMWLTNWTQKHRIQTETSDWSEVHINRKRYPSNRPWRAIGLWDVEDPTLSRQSAHS